MKRVADPPRPAPPRLRQVAKAAAEAERASAADAALRAAEERATEWREADAEQIGQLQARTPTRIPTGTHYRVLLSLMLRL